MKGPMLICFFLRKDQHCGKSLPFCHYNSHEHPMNISCVFWRCSQCPAKFKTCQSADFSCVEALSFEIRGR